MDTAKLRQAVELAQKVRHVIVATSDVQGTPHIAAAGHLAMVDGMLGISSWYCPVTLTNIQSHPQITIAIWDIASDTGYQLLGRFDRMRDMAVLDGYSPKVEGKALYIQTERELLVRVEKIFFFSQGLHADTEE